MMSDTIAVLGPGSWGTALAMVLARNGVSVRLWGHDAAQIQHIQHTGNNQPFVDEPLPAGIFATTDLRQACADIDDVLIVVPTVAFPSVLQQLSAIKPTGWRIAWGTKGLAVDPPRLLSALVCAQFGDACPMAVLSGPSFAAEVSAGLKTCVSIAGNDHNFVTTMQQRFACDDFSVVPHHDVVGVCLGGVIKNVIAIVAGMSDGLGWGSNARCALISWGYRDMSTLIVALGGETQTLTSVACIGDLILTSSDDQSRNRRFGLAIGGGQTPAAAEQGIGSAVEGFANVSQICAMAHQHGVTVPLLQAAYDILIGEQPAQDVLAALFAPESAD